MVTWTSTGTVTEEEFPGAEVAECRPLSAGKHSGHPASPVAQPPMPDRVHTAMNAVQASCLRPTQPASLMDADSFELGDRNLLAVVGLFLFGG